MANKTPKKKIDSIPVLIERHRGNVSAIARHLKLTRTTLLNNINADPELKQLLAEERERMLDNAEDKLGQAVSGGEAWAVCFTLKTQGKGRGYVERQEHTGKDGDDLVPKKYIIEIVTNDGNGTTTDQD